MELQSLTRLLSETKYKKQVIAIAGEIGDSPQHLLKLCLAKDPNVAAKASWVFRAWAHKHPIKALQCSTKLPELITNSKYDPVIRNILGAIRDLDIPEKTEARLCDLCLSILNRESHAVAVHANALCILLELGKRHPEMKNEFFLGISRNKALTERLYKQISALR